MTTQVTAQATATRSLFESARAGDLSLPNRIVMAPLTRNRAPGALPNALMQRYYVQRASAGLIITEATAISPQAQGYADVPGLWSAQQVQGWRRITDAVHDAGGRIACQLWHVGRISHVSLQPDGGAPVAPSALAAKAKTVLLDTGTPRFVETSVPRALDAAEIPAIVDDYARAARHAIEAGFDAVEIHAANGYLIEQFLKTGANQRTDEWGGGIEGRARFLLAVTRAIAAAIGGGRTGIRLSPVTPANDIHDADPQPLYDHVMRHLAPLGLAWLHVIEGSTGGPRELPDRPFDYAAMRQAHAVAGGQAAWMVNNAYDAALAQQAVAAGADLVAFGKAFIANPDLVERLRTGAPLNAAQRSTFYGGGEQGYTDYPFMNEATAGAA